MYIDSMGTCHGGTIIIKAYCQLICDKRYYIINQYMQKEHHCVYLLYCRLYLISSAVNSCVLVAALWVGDQMGGWRKTPFQSLNSSCIHS